MKNYEEVYEALRKELTEEEIASSILIPKDLTEVERQKADEALREFRFGLLNKQTEEQRIYADLLRFRYLLEDYINEETYSEVKIFGKQLEEYGRILKKTKKTLSEDLSINYTQLSRIINNKEEPNIDLLYRLEQHSGKLIPALLWWKLVMKKQEYQIKKDTEKRKIAGAKVKNKFQFEVDK